MLNNSKLSFLEKKNPQYRQHLRDERVHMEGLLNQRFNFFIIILGAIIASFPVVQNPTQLRIVLVTGFIFELLFTIIIGRAQKRLNANLRLIGDLSNDPTEQIRSIVNKGCWLNPYNWPMANFIGYYIPIGVTIALFLSIIYTESFFTIIKETHHNQSKVNTVPTINEKILDAQIKHSVYLERYKSGVLKKIIGLLSKTEGELIEQITARLVKIEKRGYDLGEDTTKRLNALLDEIRERRSKVYSVLVNQLFAEMADFTRHEADFQIKLSDNAGIAIDLSMPSNAQLKAVVQSQLLNGRLLHEWTKGLEQADVRRLQTTDQIVQRIRGKKSMQYQDGILEISRRDAEAFVPTAVAHTQSCARMEVFNTNSDVISGVLYHRC